MTRPRLLAVVLALVLGSPGLAQEDGAVDLGVRFEPGTSRTESMQARATFEVGGGVGTYHVEYTWEATVTSETTEDGTPVVRAEVVRVTGRLDTLDADPVRIDSDADPPVSAEGSAPNAPLFPRLVGKSFTYAVPAEGEVVVEGWAEAVSQATEEAELDPENVDGPLVDPVSMRDALGRVYRSVAGAGTAGSWDRAFAFAFAGDLRLETDDRFERIGPGQAEPSTEEEASPIEGIRIEFEGDPGHAPEGGAGLPLEGESRDGTVIASPMGDTILFYREASRYGLGSGEDVPEGIGGRFEFGLQFRVSP